jgi:hypothetical protein
MGKMATCAECNGEGFLCADCNSPCEPGHPCEGCGGEAAKCYVCEGKGEVEMPDEG